jgi:hypothetical protein
MSGDTSPFLHWSKNLIFVSLFYHFLNNLPERVDPDFPMHGSLNWHDWGKTVAAEKLFAEGSREDSVDYM